MNMTFKHYLIFKRGKKYHVIDTLKILAERNNDKDLILYKNNRLYQVFKEINIKFDFEWGKPVKHFNYEKIYLGKVVFMSDDIEETALEFFKLLSNKGENKK